MKRKKSLDNNPRTIVPVTNEIPFSQHLYVVVFIFAAVFLAYSNSLNATWVMDDSSIEQIKSIAEEINDATGDRIIARLTFVINKWIDPNSPVNYRIVNIIIHVASSILLYCIAYATLRLPRLKEKYSIFSFPVALLSSVIFALHPININAVAYIIQRATALAAMFVMLTLLCYILGRTSTDRRTSAICFVFAALFFLLGYFSKQNAIMALPLLMIYDYIFISPGGKDKFVFKVIIAELILGGVFLFFNAFGIREIIQEITDIYLNFNRVIPVSGMSAVDITWTPLQHVLTEFRVITRYLGLIIAPLPDFFVFDYWGFPLSTGIMHPPATLLSFFLIAGLLVFSVTRIRKTPFLSFGILWYFCAISLESFIVIGLDLYFEHRNYLPVAGLIFGVTAQTVVSLRDIIPTRKQIYVAAIILALILGGLTFQRNKVWKNSIILWTDTIEKAPRNFRAIVTLGNYYMLEGDLASAAAVYEKALQSDAFSLQMGGHYVRDAAYHLGMLYILKGENDKAEKIIALMETKLQNTYATEMLKGFYDSARNNPLIARNLLSKEVSYAKKGEIAIIFVIIGDSYRLQYKFDRALELYKKAVEINPSIAVAYFGIGDVYFSKKDIERSKEYFSKALALDPNNPLILARMADIMLAKKAPLNQALQYAERAVSLSPSFSQPYETMAWVLIAMGNEMDAEKYFQKAQKFGLTGYMLKFSKARAYFLKGDKEKAKLILLEIAQMDDTPKELKQKIQHEINASSF